MARKDAVPILSSTPNTLPKEGVSRFRQIAPFIGCSRETWRKLVRAGKAPQPVRLSPRCTAYPNLEMHRWFADPANYQAKETA